MKEMLLCSTERLFRAGRVPKARSERNFKLFLSRLMAAASQGNSGGISARRERSQRTEQLLSGVQEQEGGQERTQAQRARRGWGRRTRNTTAWKTGLE